MNEQVLKYLKQTKQNCLVDKCLNNDKLNEEEIILLIITHLNLNYPQEALQLVNMYENHISKKYYDFCECKINAYIDNKLFEEAKRIILNELDVPYIPDDFEKFLKSSLKDVNYGLNETKFELRASDLKNLDKLTETELMLILPQLQLFNLNPYIQQIQTIFNRSDISNITKSLLLATLTDLKIDSNFCIQKHQKTFLINPIKAKDLRLFESFIYLQNKIKEISIQLEVNDLSIFKQLIEMLLLEQYPYELTLSEADSLFYAVIKFINDVKESPIQNQEFMNYYSLHSKDVDKYYEILLSLLKNI